jgi:hypothetical protein
MGQLYKWVIIAILFQPFGKLILMWLNLYNVSKAGTGKMRSMGQERRMEKCSLSHSNVQVLLMSVLIYAVQTANILNSILAILLLHVCVLFVSTRSC